MHFFGDCRGILRFMSHCFFFVPFSISVLMPHTNIYAHEYKLTSCKWHCAYCIRTCTFAHLHRHTHTHSELLIELWSGNASNVQKQLIEPDRTKESFICPATCIQRTTEKLQKIEADPSLPCSKLFPKDSNNTDCDNHTNKSHASTAEKDALPVLSLASCYRSENWNLQVRDSSIPESVMNPALFVGQSAANMRLPPCKFDQNWTFNSFSTNDWPKHPKEYRFYIYWDVTHTHNSKHASTVFFGGCIKCIAYVHVKYGQNQYWRRGPESHRTDIGLK